ncbi:MAG: endonuclease/exonuclease/phosphatase family protein [Thermoanaerobaculia bacterium]
MLKSLLLGLVLVPAVWACALAAPAPAPPTKLRVATFNVMELSLAKLAEVDAAGRGSNPQLLAAAKILKRVRPDILLLQEIDLERGPHGEMPVDAASVARRFAELYLAVGEQPLAYRSFFAAATNTGVPSGLDLNGDGVAAGWEQVGQRSFGEDCFGFGTYPGQYSMAVLSRYPLAPRKLRSFQRLLWKDLPGNHLPRDYYPEAARAVLRLSSKSHWDLPLELAGGTLHLWVSHPTPPAFDGPEDKNGRRNFDEIGFWRLYLDGDRTLKDDQGTSGGYGLEDPFVVLGDLNASPYTGETPYEGRTAISQLLDHPRIQDPAAFCTSRGGLAFGGGASGPPRYPERATATFLGGHRADYVLPSRNLDVLAGGVFWPSEEEDPQAHAWAEAASDHRLVWLDLAWPPKKP